MNIAHHELPRPGQPPPQSDLATVHGYRADVQGLRGVAVLAVVLFHAQVLFPGGFVGVDVFFVLSGFVIGRLLVAEFASTGRASFRSFYLRRARRLLPALALMLTIVMLLAPLFGPTGASSTTPRTGAAAALFSANAYLYRATDVGYFGAEAELNPLLHTWSLSVEEQFYLLMPAVLLLAWTIGNRWHRQLTGLRTVIAAVCVLSLAGSIVLSWTGSIGGVDGLRFAFFSPFTRAWQFAAGLALVVLPPRWFGRRSAQTGAFFTGAVLVGATVLTYSSATRYPGAAALLPTAGTALLILAGTGTEAAPREAANWLARRPLIWLGDISYSWYLWHWPLIVFAGAFWPDSGRIPLVVAALASLVPAWVSYRFVEQRLRATKTSRGVPTLLIATCCICVPLAAAVLAVPLENAISSRSRIAAFEESRQLHAGWAAGCISDVPIGLRIDGACSWNADGTNGSVVLIGDSNADHFSEALIDAANTADMSLQIASMASCPLISGAVVVFEGEDPEPCRRFVEESVAYLERNPPAVVVIANATDAYLDQDRASLINPTAASLGAEATKAALYGTSLERVARRLVTAGSRVVIINVVPKPWDHKWDARECSNALLLVDPTRCLFPAFPMSESRFLDVSNELERDAAVRAGAEIWNFNEEICPAGECIGWREDALVWQDYGHISVVTSARLAISAGHLLQRDQSTEGTDTAD